MVLPLSGCGGLDAQLNAVFGHGAAGHMDALGGEQLAKTLYENRLDRFEEAESIMRKLYSSFVKVAELDTSEPIMSNTQQVYAGMTYGKGS